MLNFREPKFINFCRDHKIKRLELFGSFATGTASDQSDIDLIVEFHEPVGLLELLNTQIGLEDLLNRKVDLLTQNEVSPYLRKEIQAHKKVIYEEAG